MADGDPLKRLQDWYSSRSMTVLKEFIAKLQKQRPGGGRAKNAAGIKR
jgi:hypothetical protein